MGSEPLAVSGRRPRTRALPPGGKDPALGRGAGAGAHQVLSPRAQPEALSQAWRASGLRLLGTGTGLTSRSLSETTVPTLR